MKPLEYQRITDDLRDSRADTDERSEGVPTGFSW